LIATKNRRDKQREESLNQRTAVLAAIHGPPPPTPPHPLATMYSEAGEGDPPRF
jgi:hypothetical protein